MSKLLALILILSMLMGTTTAVMEHGEPIQGAGASQEDRLAAFEEKNLCDWYWISWTTEEIREWQDCNCLEGEILDGPQDGWLTKAEAVSNAKSALIDQNETIFQNRAFGPLEVNEELLDSLEINAVVCAETEEGLNVWVVWFYDRDWSEDGCMNSIDVWVNAESGEVINVVLPGDNG